MPFGDLLNCFKKNLGDVAEQYGGEAARDLVEDGIEQINAGQNEAGANGALDVDTLLQSFTGKQQGGLTDLFGNLAGSLGGLESKASDQGMDPQLIQSVMGIFGGSGSDSGGGLDMGSLLSMASVLTQGGGVQGFLKLIQGGGEGGSSKIFDILIGLAKSFFAMKMGKSPALQGWDAAGAGKNQNDDNMGKWADNLIGDLVFPGKKPKEIVQDDEDPKGKDTNEDDVKGNFNFFLVDAWAWHDDSCLRARRIKKI